MSRTIRNQRLDSREGRSKLPVRREPHWAQLARGWHLGYRKLAAGKGTWIARYRGRNYGKRLHKALGEADDCFEADGVKFLSYRMAQDAAEQFFKQAERQGSDGDEPHQRAALTVRRAIDEYLEARELEGRGRSVKGDRTL